MPSQSKCSPKPVNFRFISIVFEQNGDPVSHSTVGNRRWNLIRMEKGVPLLYNAVPDEK